MTREEAILEIGYILFEQDHPNRKEVIKALKQPVTLCDFLGWEEGQEYEWRDEIFRINSDILQVWDKDDERWYDSTEEINDYLRLRQAKKVEEPKLKAYHVRDEYSFKELQKELESKGIHKYKGQEYLPADFFKDDNSIYVFVENETWHTSSWCNLPRDRYIIEYHKEEPKYYAKIKGTDLLNSNFVYVNYNTISERLELGIKSERGNWKTNFKKKEWKNLGVTDENFDFNEVE